MDASYEIEKREYTRLDVSLPVEYRFLAWDNPDLDREIYKGETENLSGGGVMLSGSIPEPKWITDLLMGKIIMGLKISLPLPGKQPVKALARVSWVESKKTEDNKCLYGLRFKEITSLSRDNIVEFVIENHLP